MATKQELIEQAAGEFGIGSGFDLSPEELLDGLRRLNRLAAQWTAQGIDVGYDQAAALGDESGIPDTAEHAFATNLAVAWAPAFGKQVSQDTRSAARAGWNALYTSLKVRPQMAQAPRLPLGQGFKRSVIDQQFFPDPGDTVEGL